MENKNYFVGLDIGTDSVGYAVTDTTSSYNLLKYSGEPMWGVNLFDEAEHCKQRRIVRTARRRLDRRQQRVKLTQELFAKEISKVDSNFYRRISESGLLRSDSAEPYCLFNDKSFSDKDYHKKYPTIHHLICDLMNNKEPHDVRLVYIACAWLVAHRGHFLSDVSIDNVSELHDLLPAYNGLMNYFKEYPFDGDYSDPWTLNDSGIQQFGNILKQHGVSKKKQDLSMLLFNAKRPAKEYMDGEVFPFNVKCIVELLSGGTGISLSELFNNADYEGMDKISLVAKDEDFEAALQNLGDDGELLLRLKAVYDWSVLNDLLSGNQYISESKVDIYDKHKSDLRQLKSLVKKYYDDKTYNQIFRKIEKNNYVSYSGKIKSTDDGYSEFEKCNIADFNLFLKSTLQLGDENKKNKLPVEFVQRILDGVFMPKQVNGDNRVIPYQLYYVEMKKLLGTASSYLPFLSDKDNTGLTIAEKLLSIMKFRVPYYVGPLNKHNNEHAWIERKAEGRIYPWNFEDLVDLDKSEQMFINRMTNTCTYLAGEDVLPKKSFLYEKFEVLNEINNIKIQGKDIPVHLKQALYNEVFLTKKRVSLSAIKKHFRLHNVSEEDVETISGIDKDIKSSLSSRIAFDRLLESKTIGYSDAEAIIKRKTFSEDNNRFKKWLKSNYAHLSQDDVKYISSLSIKEFGNLSEKLISGIKGNKIDFSTGELLGEPKTIIELMWENNVNLSELVLSDAYSFKGTIIAENKLYYSEHKATLSERLDEMYVSNSVKRPIIRTLEIINDVVKANNGTHPAKIFVEMARGTKEDLKGKRTKTRKQQILELYEKVKGEDVRELKKKLDEYGDEADNKLQSDRLFLYYLQLGKSMYSGETIDIEKLSEKIYDVDHIYPQSFVKDDSVINNKVLVLSTENGAKDNVYPISSEIRSKMKPIWDMLLANGLMSEEKHKRLTRSTPFTEEEEWEFINRQLVETRQSTRVVAELLQEKYPNTEIVYVKAGLVSDFRQNYDISKSRAINDLHHAKDAYLNIVCGNVYHSKFTKKWFLDNWQSKNFTTSGKALFNHSQTVDGICVWDGEKSLSQVKSNVQKNNCHMTFFSFMKKHGQNGGFFDQNPIKAVKAPTVSRKTGLDTSKYGGYDGLTTSFLLLAKYKLGKKYVKEFIPVVLLEADKVQNDNKYALEYVKRRLDSKAEDVSLLLDGRPIKIGTVIEVDGLRMLVGGQGSKNDGRIGFKVFTPLVLSYADEKYVKTIESFKNKISRNDKLLYSKEYDTVNKEENAHLYSILQEKMQSRLYLNRPENQVEKLKNNRGIFDASDEKTQCSILLNIISQFNRAALADTQLKIANVCRLNPKLSNWGYSNVRIIDSSASGIWEKQSDNLIVL